jgi:hypothetical protein
MLYGQSGFTPKLGYGATWILLSPYLEELLGFSDWASVSEATLGFRFG